MVSICTVSEMALGLSRVSYPLAFDFDELDENWLQAVCIVYLLFLAMDSASSLVIHLLPITMVYKRRFFL
jgi:hypothetical protein